MEENTGKTISDSLPIKSDLTRPIMLTYILLVLMTILSAASFLLPEVFYPAESQRLTFLTNDLVNLIVGVPLFILVLNLIRKERLIGLILWPGALFYVIYNYLAYFLGMSFSWQSGLFGAMVLLAVLTGYSLLSRLDFTVLAEELSHVGPRVVASVIVLIFGLGFLIQAVIEITGFVSGSGELSLEDFGVFSADLVGSVIWLISGLLLLLRKPAGYLLGWSGLFAVVALNVGLLVFLIVLPLIAGADFLPLDFLVIVVFTSVCSIPFGLFIKDLNKVKKL